MGSLFRCRDIKFRLLRRRCTEDVWIRLKWNGKVITPEIPVMAKIFQQVWVPSEYQKVTGDGAKKFELEAKQIATKGLCFGEVVGEERQPTPKPK